jgi:beta-lactamase class A
VYYDGSFDDSKAQYFKPQKLIQAGHSYTIDELLTYAIAYSDNNAERLLDQSFEPSTLNNIFLNLGIQIPAQPQDFMTTETYAEFLRLLYNSTYLSPEMSDKALGLMAQPDFPQGLEAGIPQSVQVAQKFGERQVLTPNGMLLYRELHDCGIVYAQNDPYVLCVMTRGQDFNVLASIIANVSKISYDYVDANRAH